MLPLCTAQVTRCRVFIMIKQSAAVEIDENANDRSLVAATLAGDSDALAVLHRRYYLRIYRLALVRCGSTPDAEDVAAETFVRAITHLASYRFQGESLFPWLARIATNLAADQRRRSRGVSFVSLDGTSASDTVSALIDALPGDAPDPHTAAEQHEVRVLVRAAIATLPPDQADAVILRFLGDLSLKEIAAALRKSEGAIKSLLHRAVANLRTSLSNGDAAAAVFGRTQTAGQGSIAAEKVGRADAKAVRRNASVSPGQDDELIWERSDTR